MAIPDRYLWFSLGIAAFLAVKAIQHTIQQHIQLTALDDLESLPDSDAPPLEPIPEGHKDDNTIPLSALRSLTAHPNPKISWAAQAYLVEQILRDERLLKSVGRDAEQTEDVEKRRRARRALNYLEEWDTGETYRYPGGGYETESDRGLGQEEMVLSPREFDEMVADLGGRRFTYLEEEIGEDRYEGHEENARMLGVENFPGLEASRWAPEEVREEGDARRSRREAMVIEDRSGGSGGGGGESGGDGRQGGWSVVRSVR